MHPQNAVFNLSAVNGLLLRSYIFDAIIDIIPTTKNA